MSETGQTATGEERRKKMAKEKGNARLTILFEALRPQMEEFAGSLEKIAPGMSDDLLSVLKRGAEEMQGDPFNPNNPTHRRLKVIATVAESLRLPEKLRALRDYLGTIDNQ